MSFEDLSHTPEFELPTNAPSAPADLISLLDECREGLSKAIVSRMIRRGKYEQVAVVICQENATKKTSPIASSDDIADYCMMCMQYHIEKNDDPGTYRCMLIGPPGRGRFERAKHVELGEGDGMARSKTMLSEGDLLEQQTTYIGELHAQSIAVLETLHGMVVPLIKENKEQMKIISESARRLAEVERDRQKFDLEMRIHNDDQKLEEAREEMKNQRWSETMEVIKDSGMVEGFMKAAIKRIKGSGTSTSDDGDGEETEKKKKKGKKSAFKKRNKKSTEDSHGNEKKNRSGESRIEKAKKKKRGSGSGKKKKTLSDETQRAVADGDDLSSDQLEEVFKLSGMEKAKDNPIALMVEILKMSIDENDQWPMVEKTLSEKQFKLFNEIMNSESDGDIEKKLKSLYEMKGARRLMKFEQHLKDDQKGYVERLLEIAMSD